MREYIDRFLAKTDRSGPCWLWLGRVGVNGYGYFDLNRVPTLAHRVSYEAFIGPIPAGLVLCHTCDVKTCVRPDHLVPGTDADNLRDTSQKGRLRNNRVTHCPAGHPYTGDNLYIRPSKPSRECRACRRQRKEARRAMGLGQRA